MKKAELKEMEVLTNRETEVLRHIANGHSNTQIGRLLEISHRTVDSHRTNIRNKLGVHNLAQMIKYALKEGIVD
jgi:two-component system nitrate/nitrite response regulator NarL